MSSGQGLIEDYDIGDSQDVTIGAVGTNRSTALVPGLYSLLGDADCYIRRGTAAGATATTSHFILKANTYCMLRVKPSHIGLRDAVATLQKGAGGTLRITKHGGVD